MCYKKFWWKPDLVKSGYQKIMENAAEHQIFTILQMQVSFSKALKIYVFIEPYYFFYRSLELKYYSLVLPK